MAVRRVHVPRQVFLADVFSDADEMSLRQLDQHLAGLVEYAADINTAREMRLLRALTEPELEPDEEAGWGRLYIELGLDSRWLQAMHQLRVRSNPGFAEVYESRGMLSDNYWENNNGHLVRVPRPPFQQVAPAVEVYTLGMTAEFGGPGMVPNDREGIRAVSRYGEGGRSDAKVRALAEALSPRVASTFGGDHRLALAPVVVPLAAMAAAVWAAMKHPAMRRPSGGRDSLRWEGFYACLDALDLGHHQKTAARILRRSHPQHIRVSTAGLPPRVAPAEWAGSLGILTTTAEGLLIEQRHVQERVVSAPPNVMQATGSYGDRLRAATAGVEALLGKGRPRA